MSLKKISKIIKNFKAIAITYAAKNVDWYIYDEDYTKEKVILPDGSTDTANYDLYMQIDKIFTDGLEEDDDFLKELSELKAGDTIKVDSLILPRTSQKDFIHGDEENLKIRKVEIKRGDKNLYEVHLTVAPIEVMYEQGRYSDDYNEWKSEYLSE